MVVIALASCGDNRVAQIDLAVPAGQLAAFEDFVALSGYRGARVHVDATTGEFTEQPGQLSLRVVVDLTCSECYRLDPVGDNDRAWEIHTGDLLGAQYGVAHAFENLGFRFRHPSDPSPPTVPVFDEAARDSLGVLHEPAQRVRGLQLHTIHPIEGYYAFWQPGEQSAGEARRIIDWVIKNRGNWLHWIALDDIMEPTRHAEWVASTQEVIAYAHARGIRVGLGLQLFGQSNLQLGFDLSDDETGDVPLVDELEQRIPLITDGLPFDGYVLSFGEFFGATPEVFVTSLNEVSAAFARHAPNAELHGVVHVGANQRVTYNGEDLIYYMLVKFADPPLIADVHTVMFYDLFQDAGGAYHHDDFFEHREFLLNEIRAGRPGSYLPETAYWIAFDVSVPISLPLYVRNRWLDLDKIGSLLVDEGLPPLDTHVLFSSGWEWGYWLNDYTALRASYELPTSFEESIAQAFGNDLGPEAAAEVASLANSQQATLGDGRLIAYLAGRDFTMDVGRQIDIISQPDRIFVAEFADATVRQNFATDQLPRLLALANDYAARQARIEALVPTKTRWQRELRDGFAVTAARARFVHATYAAAIAFWDGDRAAADEYVRTMDAALADGKIVVARRHADLHAANPKTLTSPGPTATLYQYGYLRMADDTCFWRRERAQVGNLFVPDSMVEPTCYF